MSNFQLPDHLLLLLQQATDNYQSIDAKHKVGRPPTYSALSFLLLAITAVVLRTFDEIELHRLLLADSDLLSAGGFPQPPAASQNHRAQIEAACAGSGSSDSTAGRTD